MKEKQKSIMYLGIKTPFAALIKVLKFITMSLISMLQVQCTHPSMYLCYLQLPYSITRLFWHYSRLSNRHRLLNRCSLNFHIMILINFYINLGIVVIFDFFPSTFSKKIWFMNKRRPATIWYSRVLQSSIVD